MKKVYVIRHANRDKVQDKLTEEGIRQAKNSTLGIFDIAISSEANRAKQTAELITGKTVVQDYRANLSKLTSEERTKVDVLKHENPYGAVGAVFQIPSLTEKVFEAGRLLSELIKETLTKLPKDGKALIVSHDGPIFFAEKILKNEKADRADKTFGSLAGFVIAEDGKIRVVK